MKRIGIESGKSFDLDNTDPVVKKTLSYPLRYVRLSTSAPRASARCRAYFCISRRATKGAAQAGRQDLRIPVGFGPKAASKYPLALEFFRRHSVCLLNITNGGQPT
jgi:hypothetical protein